MNNFTSGFNSAKPGADLGARFTLTGASVPGRDHVSRGRNNQDGFALIRRPTALIAVVTDGCGSGLHSEVGAHLGARILAARLADELALPPANDAALDRAVHRATARLLSTLRTVRDAAAATSDGQCLHTVADTLLFTVLVAVITEDTTALYGCGDVFCIDDDVTVLDPGHDNAPDYLAYRLVDPTALSSVTPRPQLQRLQTRRTRDVNTILLATDGLTPLLNDNDVLPNEKPCPTLPDLARDPALRRGPTVLQKRLNVLGPVAGLLRDDATVAVIQRHPRGES